MGYDGSIIYETRIDQSGIRSGTDSIKKGMSGLSSAAKKLGAIVASAFAVQKIVQFGKQAVSVASDLAEVQNVVDVAFGEMSYKVEEFADNAIKNFGMSQLAAKKTASTYMAMAKNMGLSAEISSDMAITLAGLTGDVASFYNISQELADIKLKSIFTGETETLKDLGIVMTQANLKAYALSQGITKTIDSMSQSELVALRYNFVMDQLSMASGDFVRTQDSWANQTRILSMQWQEFMGAIGQSLTKILLPVVKTLNLIVEEMIGMANAINAVISSTFGETTKQLDQTKRNVDGIADGINKATDNQNSLVDSMKEANELQKDNLSSLDEIHKLSEENDIEESVNVNITPVGGAVTDIAPIDDSAFEVLKQSLNDFWEQIQTTMGPGLKAWKSAWNEIESAVTSAWITVSASATNLWNGSISPLMRRVVNEFLPNVFNSLSEAFAPILGGVGSTGITIVAENFEWYCQEVQKQIDSSLVPALESVVKIYDDISTGIQSGWDTYGKPVLEEITDFFSNVRSIVTNLWDTILSPIISNALEKVNQLWNESLKPLWDNLVLLFGSVSEYVLTGWNNVLLPFLNWIIDVFGPLFTEKIERTQLVVTTVFSAISDAINPFIVGFRGILDFMTNVFEGDWKGAWDAVSSTVTNVWDAIVNSVKNKINSIIDFINSMISGMVSGINAVIRVMNKLSFDVPDWIPGIGGKHFGIDIKEVTAAQIPRLAQGAVIPPNREFLAVLGDQRSGTNIEAPLETIKQAVAEVMAGMGGNNYTVNATANGRVLFQVMINEAENVMAQTGRNPFNLA